MPSRCTAIIQEGGTFKEFALKCARSFGPLYTLRDEPSNIPIPDVIKPNTYHLKQIEEYKKELDFFSNTTDSELEILLDSEFEESYKSHTNALKENRELRSRYEDALRKANDYIAPTDNHIEYKKFMIELLEESIHFDCDESYYLEHVPIKKSLEDFKKERIESIKDSIKYHTKNWEDELERSHKNTEWAQALKKSLEVTE
jgi:hypothetical protein